MMVAAFSEVFSPAGEAQRNSFSLAAPCWRGKSARMLQGGLEKKKKKNNKMVGLKMAGFKYFKRIRKLNAL